MAGKKSFDPTSRPLLLLSVVAMVSLGLAAGIGSALYYVIKKRAENDPTRIALESIVASEEFETPRLPTDSEADEFAKVIQVFLTSLKTNPGFSFEQHFDLGRFLVEFERNWKPEFEESRFSKRESRKDTLANGKADIRSLSSFLAKTHCLDETTVRLVSLAGDGREAIVVADHIGTKDELSTRSKIRWWLTKREGSWKLFDYEWTNNNRRWSDDAIHIYSTTVLKNYAQIASQIDAFHDALASLSDSQYDDAEKHLEPLRHAELAKRPKAYRELIDGFLTMQRSPETSLKHFETARTIEPQMTLTWLGQSYAETHQKRYAEALRTAQHYLSIIGPDSQGYQTVGETLEYLKRPVEALSAFRQSLDADPDDIDAFQGLLRTLPADEKLELAERAAASRFATARFRNAFDRLSDASLATREAYVEAYLRLKPNDLDAQLAQAKLAIANNQIEKATARFRTVYARSDESDRAGLMRQFLDSCPPESSIAVYESLADLDRRTIFQLLAQNISVKDAEWLDDESRVHLPRNRGIVQSLIDKHSRIVADDPWLDFFRGQLAEVRKDWVAADRFYLAASEKIPAFVGPPNPDENAEDERQSEAVTRFRTARLNVWFRWGKGIEAYNQFGADLDTFVGLAWQYLGEKDANGLSRLIDIHAVKHKFEPELAYWRGELAWLKRDYPSAVGHYRDYLRPLTANERDESIRYAYRAHQNLIRGLIRTGQHADAEAALRQYGERGGRYLRLVVAASRGNVNRVYDLLAEMKSGDYDGTSWIYRDEDLAPLLRTPAFERIRIAFPEVIVREILPMPKSAAK